jgi:hypothetical protein
MSAEAFSDETASKVQAKDSDDDHLIATSNFEALLEDDSFTVLVTSSPWEEIDCLILPEQLCFSFLRILRSKNKSRRSTVSKAYVWTKSIIFLRE